jgi:hypothetical protein
MTQSDLDVLERDVETARDRLASDIARWRDPATMSDFKDTVIRKATSLKDELVREASDTATDTAEGLWSDMKRRASANPWAALAIGAGLTWHLVRHPPISSVLIGFGLISLLRTNRSSAPAPIVTTAVEYAGTAADWAETASSKVQEWGKDLGVHAEAALGQAEEALGRAEQTLDQVWRTTSRAATRASEIGQRAVRDTDTRDGLLLGAAVLGVGGALFFAIRGKGEDIRREQQAHVIAPLRGLDDCSLENTGSV